MNKSILVVDDDPSVLAVFELILRQAGHTVHTALSGDEAVKMAQSDVAIDLVFLDVKMPGMSGIEAYRNIQKARPRLLAVMMTGFSVDELLKEAFELGAYGVIYKPFDTEEVISIVNKIFKTSSVIGKTSGN